MDKYKHCYTEFTVGDIDDISGFIATSFNTLTKEALSIINEQGTYSITMTIASSKTNEPDVGALTLEEVA